MPSSSYELPQELFRSWGHSREEDQPGITVYRPTGYHFPPARGRRGIEFRADGSFVDWAIGPADGSQGIAGKWQIEAPGRVRVSFEESSRPARILEIQQVDENILKVREKPA